MAQYAFQIRTSNDRNEDLQNITGEYFVSTTPTACNAGFLCNKGAHMPEGGYEMAMAADGSLPLYACNPSNVRRVPVGDNTYAVGVETLGLGIPAGEKDTFTKLIVDEVYAFGPSNFSTLVTTTNKYATVNGGLLEGTSSQPTSGDGFYFELDAGLGIDTFVAGNFNEFARYNLVLRYI